MTKQGSHGSQRSPDPPKATVGGRAEPRAWCPSFRLMLPRFLVRLWGTSCNCLLLASAKLCLFWSQSSYVAACVPPSLPLGSVFLDLQDLRSLCALSSWLPGHHNGPSSLPEAVALQASAALLQGHGVSFLLFTRPSCPLGLPHTGSGPLSSPCLWLIAELLLPLAGLLF